MELKGDDSFSFRFWMIVRKVHGCNAVHLMDLSITNSNDRQLVPFAINKLLILVTHLAHNFWFAVITDNNLLKSFRNDTSPFLGVQHAVELRLGVQIRLISFYRKVFGLTKNLTTILHTSIVARETNFQFEHKVTWLSALPDEKRVRVHRVLFCGLPHNGTILH